MARILIASPASDSDRYAFSAGSQAATMEVQNLQLQQPGDWWRAIDPSNAYVVIQQSVDARGNLDPWNLIWPGYANIGAGGTWRIRCANTLVDLTASPLYDSGVMTFWPATDLYDWPWVSGFSYTGSQLQIYPYTRIDFYDLANSDGWVQVGRLYQCKAWEPEFDVKAGWSLKYIHAITREETQGGQIYPMPGPGKRRALKFNIQFSSEDDMWDNAFEIDRNRGAEGDVLVIKDRASRHVHKHMVYGLITDLGEIINDRGKIYQKNYGVEELPQ